VRAAGAAETDLPAHREFDLAEPARAVAGLAAGLEEAHLARFAERARRRAEAALEVAVEEAARAIVAVAVVVGVALGLSGRRHVAGADLGDRAATEAFGEAGALGVAQGARAARLEAFVAREVEVARVGRRARELLALAEEGRVRREAARGDREDALVVAWWCV